MRSSARIVFCFLLPFLAAACATGSRVLFYQLDADGKLNQKSLERVLWENEMAPGERIKNAVLFPGDEMSAHLIQIKGEETLHRHDFHDLTVFVQQGRGTLILGEKRFKLGAGAVVFIPHGVPHRYINAGPNPSVAVAVFAPPFDGKDAVEVDGGRR